MLHDNKANISPASICKLNKSNTIFSALISQLLQPRKVSDASTTSIKTAILLTPGPVSTFSALQYSGPRAVRHISKEQYIEAVMQLQDELLGTVVMLKKGSSPSAVCFIKKPPEQIGELAAFKGYDSVDENMYMERYKLPVPGSIRKRIWSKLIALGYFPAEEEPLSGIDLLRLGQMEDEPRT